MNEARSLRIVSGGQTGADRAALDAATQAGVECGGWCPAGRIAEDGVIPQRYPVTEVANSGGYDERTIRNVLDSDATVILSFGPPEGGSETTRSNAISAGRPLLIIDARHTSPRRAAEQIAEFAQAHGVRSLNVAGPRESEQPLIGPYVHDAIAMALRQLEGVP
jgi:hypothetical protein